MLDEQGNARLYLAEVLTFARKVDDAGAAIGEALRLYERKGNVVKARRSQIRLTELHQNAPYHHQSR